MQLPFTGKALSTNDSGLITYTAAVAFVVTKLVGGSVLSWPLTLCAVTGCILLPSFLDWARGKLGELTSKGGTAAANKKPKVGGDVTITMGVGENGGPPGRAIFLRKQADPARPISVWFDEQTGGQLNVYMGPASPRGEIDAPECSFYVQHFRKGPPPVIWWKNGPSLHDWEPVLGRQPN